MKPRLRLRAVPLLVMALVGSTATAVAQQPFGQTSGLFVAADGRHAYTADEHFLAAFRRDPQTGALTFTTTAGGRTGGTASEMTPDGRAIYLHSPDSREIRSATIAPDGRPRVGPATTSPSPAGFRGASMIFTRDGRTLFLGEAGPRASTIAVYTRDPETGFLGRRGHVGPPAEASDEYDGPGLAISPDDRFLYATYGRTLHTYALDRGPLPVLVEDPPVRSYGKPMVVSPQGDRLYSVISDSITAFARNPDTGSLRPLQDAQFGGSGGDYGDRTRRSLIVAPEGRTVLAVDPGGDRLLQASVTSDGLAPLRSYRNFDEGIQGLDNPTAVTLSPEGAYVYVSAGRPPGYATEPSRIVIFRRDAATEVLSFEQVVTGINPPQPAPGACGIGCNGQGEGVKVQINGGAEFTNSADVTLTIRPDGVPSDLDVSNDGGFLPGRRVPLRTDGRYAWTLQSSGPERLPKTVYVRHHDYGLVARDDIVLDETMPVVVSAVPVLTASTGTSARAARSGGRRIRVVARDTTSGVARVQSAARRGGAGPWKRLGAKGVVRVAATARWVRVADGAGNRSRWRRIAVKR